jgi:hypothetical protein
MNYIRYCSECKEVREPTHKHCYKCGEELTDIKKEDICEGCGYKILNDPDNPMGHCPMCGEVLYYEIEEDGSEEEDDGEESDSGDGEQDDKESEDVEQEPWPVRHSKKRGTPSNKELCPCGSGKKFAECCGK